MEQISPISKIAIQSVLSHLLDNLRILFYRCALLLVSIITSTFVGAQRDTAVIVDVVEILDYKLRANNLGGTEQDLPLSAISNADLSSILSENSGIYIKNYGPGSIATSSIRGGSSSHTLLLWNDLPIQNPYLGLLDLSLMNTAAIDRLTLYKGGNSAMWGSGAIGAVINMEQKNIQSSKFTFENLFTLGSFGKIQEKVKASIKFAKIRSTTSYDFLQAKNDYSFEVNPGQLKRQSNAQQKQINFNQDFYYTPNSSNEIAFHFWHSSADRQIPPLTTQRESQAYQLDQALRISSSWSYYGSKLNVKTNLGYFDEDLDYHDPSIMLESRTNFRTFIGDFNVSSKQLGLHRYNIGLSYVNSKVSSLENYAEDPEESKLAIFGRYLLQKEKFKFQISGRQELVNNKLIPIMPSFEMAYNPSERIRFKSKISRNYRLPTLNDRFWNPGGNPELIPESGWSEELTIQWNSKDPKNRLSTSLTGFNKIIDNWIQWSLQDGSNIWSAYNLNKVWSRGLEPRIGYEIKRENNKLEIDLGYDYILSTNQVSIQTPSIEKGDQLWYTPEHSIFANIGLNFKSLSGNFNHRWVGPTIGINDNLKAFSIANLNLAWKTKIKTIECQLIGRINNIWNSNYRIVERRPMPGRNFEVGINLKILK